MDITETLYVKSGVEWRKWLAKNHKNKKEILIKKGVKVLQFVTHYPKFECVNLNLCLEKKETQKILKIEK